MTYEDNLAKAYLLYETGDCKGSMKELNKIFRTKPFDRESLILAHLVNLRLEDFEKTWTTFNKILKLFPNILNEGIPLSLKIDLKQTPILLSGQILAKTLYQGLDVRKKHKWISEVKKAYVNFKSIDNVFSRNILASKRMHIYINTDGKYSIIDVYKVNPHNIYFLAGLLEYQFNKTQEYYLKSQKIHRDGRFNSPDIHSYKNEALVSWAEKIKTIRVSNKKWGTIEDFKSKKIKEIIAKKYNISEYKNPSEMLLSTSISIDIGNNKPTLKISTNIDFK